MMVEVDEKERLRSKYTMRIAGSGVEHFQDKYGPGANAGKVKIREAADAEMVERE